MNEWELDPQDLTELIECVTRSLWAETTVNGNTTRAVSLMVLKAKLHHIEDLVFEQARRKECQ